MPHLVPSFRWAVVLLLPLLVIVQLLFHGRSPAQDTGRNRPAVHIRITDALRYDPDTVTIKVGDTVEWENVSRLMHTVTADPAKATRARSIKLPAGASTFDSGDLEPGKKFRYTFVVPGTYRYFCVPYEAAGMVGEIEVLPVSVGKK